MRYDFYHLSLSSESDALPKLLNKIISNNEHAVILTDTKEHVKYLDDFLWNYEEESWLPHNSIKDGSETEQPIFITNDLENPNQAKILILLHAGELAPFEDFSRTLDIFDGNNQESLAKARKRWKTVKEKGWELHYWQQTEKGWQEKI